jgi:hypothetical protein
MDHLDGVRYQLEYTFLKVLVKELRDGRMTVAQAKLFAQEFVAVKPFESEEDAYLKILSFSSKYPELKELTDYVEAAQSELHVSEKIQKMKEHIKQNDIDKALEVAKA